MKKDDLVPDTASFLRGLSLKTFRPHLETDRFNHPAVAGMKTELAKEADADKAAGSFAACSPKPRKLQNPKGPFQKSE